MMDAFSYYFCIVFSVLPYDTSSAHLNAVYDGLLFKWVNYALRYVLLSLLLAFGFYYLYTDVSLYNRHHTFLQLTMLMVSFLEVIGCDLFAIVSAVGADKRFRHYTNRFVDKLNYVDRQLQAIHYKRWRACAPLGTRAGHSPTPPTTSRQITTVVSYVYVFIFVFDSIIWYYIIGLNIIFYLPVYCFKFSVLLFTIQFSKAILQLARSFTSLSKVFENLAAIKNDSYAYYTANPVHIDSSVHAVPANILTLRQLHWTLCDTVHSTNTIFGNQLVAAMLYIFVHLIVSPYFMFLDIVYPPVQGHFYGYYMVVQLLWILLHTIELHLLVVPCAITTNKANRFSSVISKLLNIPMPLESKRQLESLALQLIHHEVEFSASGLFRLDLPVITAVAGAVTAYLVILIQFQNLDLI